ncbi:MAG TPA: 50S ribosomal protein L11 methyltransferase [Flavisolibacter sp.]|nr:50S ribosomal protein L11 methyltransferase [Flavisolibacter sp.]
MSHIQITISANNFQQEELICFLSDLDPTGFEQKDSELIAYFEASHYDENTLKEILQGYTYNLEKVEEKNWNEEWERSFQPVVVEDFCAIRADFHDPIKSVLHEIIITPKMSFGTGHHATTYMMIQQMQHIDFSNKKVFDFGAGTGILSILAEKLGAAEITAIDVDEWSITNTQENCSRNNCSKVSVSLSSKIPPHQFNVILANINRNVILDYASSLMAAMEKDGTLVVSGILIGDEEDIKRKFNKGQLALKSRLQRGDWISLMFVNTKDVVELSHSN